MTARTKKAKASEAPVAKGPNNSLDVGRGKDETEAQAIARSMVAPSFRHAMTTGQLLKTHFTGALTPPGLGDYADALRERGDKAAKGDLEFVSRMLAAQASTLDTIFAEMARRMACNMGEYLGATETYARIALKAQANSRSTLEALAKLHQPREQTVRHVHVNEGGQAVIADEFHLHGGNGENGKSVKQSHATGAAGQSPALPCPDPLGNGVPISSGERETAMQDARGQ